MKLTSKKTIKIVWIILISLVGVSLLVFSIGNGFMR